MTSSRIYKGGVEQLLANPEFHTSHVHWLGRELNYLLTWGWMTTREDLEKLEELMEGLLSRELSGSREFLDFFAASITRMAEIAYENLVRYEQGANQGDNGDNALYQSSRLQEYILLGIRIGMDPALIARWKEKLREEDKGELDTSIVPEPYILG